MLVHFSVLFVDRSHEEMLQACVNPHEMSKATYHRALHNMTHKIKSETINLEREKKK